MKTSFTRFVCRVLVASLIVLPLQAQAGLIGTGGAVSVNRAHVADQLQAMGLTPQAAQERVAALTDAEVAALTDSVDSLPAGAFGGAVVGMLGVLIFLLWRFQFSEQAHAETAKPGAKPAAKPAAKPEAEKK